MANPPYIPVAAVPVLLQKRELLKRLDEFGPRKPPLYPDGLLALLNP